MSRGLIIVFLFLPLMSSASELICANKSRGYLPYNTETGKWIGDGYLFEKGDCHKAIDTERGISGPQVVCSWTGKGWNLFNSQTGIAVNRGTAYWYSLSTCQNALQIAGDGVVCAPRGTGSGVYDLHNDYFIGDGFYFDINDCIWAQRSSLAKPRTVTCAPNQGYTSVFHRRFNELVSDDLYMTAKQCHRFLNID